MSELAKESGGSSIMPTNETIQDIYRYLEQELGPQRGSLSLVMPITIFFTLIFVTGVIGNISTCVVIARNRYMHTATNFYLFSLAISDVLLLIFGLPQELTQYWHEYPYMFGAVFCIIRGLAAETSMNASIMTITAFTIERYLAICHPIKNHTMSKLSRVIKIIVLIWFAGGLMSLPILLNYGIVYVHHPDTDLIIPESAQCNVHPDISPRIFELSTFMFFIIPMCVITVLYLLIGYELRKMHLSRAPSDSSTNSGDVTLRLQICARRAVLKMLIAVVVAFFICYAPNHCQRLMVVYVTDWTPRRYHVYIIVTYVSGVLYYVSATINPILYNVMSLKFRQAFKNTLWNCFHGSHGRDKGRYYVNGMYRFTSKPIASETSGTQSLDAKGGGSGSPEQRIPLRNMGEKLDNHARMTPPTCKCRCGVVDPEEPGDPFDANSHPTYFTEIEVICRLHRNSEANNRRERLNNYHASILNDLKK